MWSCRSGWKSGRVILAMLLLATTLSSFGVMGQDSSSEEVPVAPVTHLQVGSFHTVVIISDMGVNVVKAWGANGQGQLGLNDTKDRGDSDGPIGDLLPPVELGKGRVGVEVSAGLRHSLAILDDGSVRGWGYNGKGQLGVGSIQNIGDSLNGDLEGEMGDNLATTFLGEGLKATKIYTGGWHSCAVMDNEELKCWGYNQWGELGLEDQEDRGDTPGEMGDALRAVDLGGAKVVDLSLGDWHTCVLLDTGKAACFGKNYAGQLGLGDTENRGDDEGEMGNDLRFVDLGDRTVTAVAAGEEHTCVIVDTEQDGGDVICWGLNSFGQLGQGHSDNIGDDSNEVNNLAPIDLGTGRSAVMLAAGGNHTCALLDNDAVKCWGDNTFGELGLGDVEPRGDSPGEMGDNLPSVDIGTDRSPLALSLGYYHSCMLVKPLDTDSSVLCWGANRFGQLGLALTELENIGDEPGEMGEALELANLGGHFAPDDSSIVDEVWFIVAFSIGGIVLVGCCIACIAKTRGSPGRSGTQLKQNPHANAKYFKENTSQGTESQGSQA